MLACLLFLFVIDSLNNWIPHGLHVSLFADDIALWASDPDKGAAAALVEEGVSVFAWNKETKLALNIGKCEISFFTSFV